MWALEGPGHQVLFQAAPALHPLGPAEQPRPRE